MSTLPAGSTITTPFLPLAALALALAAAPRMPAHEDASKGDTMTYREATAFLSQHTDVRPLEGPGGARVAVCPAWQGRVMTSTCGGPDGPSFGYINRRWIEAGKPDPKFNNYGGEDRMWLSPEGGQFSLWFKPGQAQTFDNWFTPPAMNEGAWAVESYAAGSHCRMGRRMQLQNASAASFDLAVSREVRLLGAKELQDCFGPGAARTLSEAGVQSVGYETINAVTNQGPAMSRTSGLVSIWMLGMFNVGPTNVVMVPYRPGDEATLGPVVKSDYFGQVPPERLKIAPQAVLFLGDGNHRSKIGTSQRRARNVMGSIDFQGEVLTLVQFTMPDDPSRHDYMNNMWELPQKSPYVGDVANSYNDGPPGPGLKPMGPFYELESLSPAVELQNGQTLTHRHRTLHVRAPLAVLARLAKDVLGVELADVRTAMFGK